MENMPLKESDYKQIHGRKIFRERILEQMDLIKRGVSNVVLDRACVVGDGILDIPVLDHKKYLDIYEKALESAIVLKFVPASGAASRMFEDIEKVLPALEEKSFASTLADKSEEEKNFLLFAQNIKKFAFYKDIQRFFEKTGKNLEKSIDEQKWQDIIKHLLYIPGLDYIHTPKALIPFHTEEEKAYTAWEEHLYEGIGYAKDAKNKVRFHFTIAPGQEKLFTEEIKKCQPFFQKQGIQLLIEFSEQHPSTETIALDLQNELVREENGEILFRPAGHGALLENLQSLDADIVFIKNIDNVVSPKLLQTTCLYKKLLAGYLLGIQSKVFSYLEALEKNQESMLEEMIHFARETWNIVLSEKFHFSPWQEKQKELFSLFYRPIRVCGMVKNQGEPGGGPFWVRDSRGKVSRQIVEKSQISLKSEDQKKILETSTHFNPVDLVCALKDHRGRKFDLKDYVDRNAVFLSQKPYHGKTIKVLELPGLWNGSMAFWNTSFVEVPLATFNPVKKVTDLLRPYLK